jgi:hypothetical protein
LPEKRIIGDCKTIAHRARGKNKTMKTTIIIILSVVVFLIIGNICLEKVRYPIGLQERKMAGFIAAPFSLGYSNCKRCGRTWNICKSHSTMYSETGGCFPLCEDCWLDLWPNERLPYYIKLMNEWDADSSQRAAVYLAVSQGK